MRPDETKTVGKIVIETDRQFRSTHASLAQVLCAIEMLVTEVGKDTPAVENARRVVRLLGHTLPEAT